MERDRILNADNTRRHPIEEVADEYGRRLRSGDKPSVAEYADRYPDLADEIQELLPAVALMERCNQGLSGSQAPPRRLGDFLLLREIGRGGMGLVYEARQISLERRVALKVLPPGVVLDAIQLQRFRREATAAARLHHTNIVPVFGMGECDGVHFFTMQFIAGRNLQQLLVDCHGGMPAIGSFGTKEAVSFVEADTRLNAAVQGTRGQGGKALSLPIDGDFYRFVARAGMQVAEALAYAHNQGVLHRDIKPSNLLVDDAGTVWVTDFGLAKSEGLEDLTAPGDYVGTLRYLAPERLQGQADSRSDLYSLGLTLYELATGQPGFDGADRPALVQQLTRCEPAPPRQINPAIPRDLEKVLLKTLEREPARRYQTGQELADDLRRFLADMPVRARPLGTLGRSWRWCRRNPAVAGLTAAVALTLVAGTVLSSIFAVRATDRARDAETSARQAREAKGEADRRLYVADLRLAQRAWEEARVGRVRELLDRQRPEQTDGVDLRGFEWFFWHRLCHTDRLTLRSHRPAIFSMAVSRDGRYLATGAGETSNVPGGKPGEIILWDLSSNQKLRVLGEQSGQIGSLAFSPDGHQVAAASTQCFGGQCSGAVRIWEVATGRQVLALDDPDRPFNCVSFSPDGKVLALTSIGGSKPDEIQLRDVADGKRIYTFLGPANAVCYQVAFHPDGRRLACASSDSAVRILDARDGREILVLHGHTQGVVRVAFSRDGQRLASASDDQTIKVWDTDTGREVAALKGHTDSLFSVAFDPNDGHRLISAGADQTVRLWDVQTAREMGTFKGHTDLVCDAIFIRDRRFLSASFDGSVKVWDEASGQVALALKGQMGRVTAVAFSPDGRRLASLDSDSMVRSWDPVTGQEDLAFPSTPSKTSGLTYSPDGRFLATTGGVSRKSGAITLWDAASGREVRTLRGHSDLTVTMAFSPDGQRLATTGNDGQVLIWDMASGRPLLTLSGHAQPGTAVAFSRDGQCITGAFQDGMLRLWEAADGRELLHRTLAAPAYVATFSPNGRRLVTAHASGLLLVWDTATGQELFGLKGHTSWVNKVVFSSDGRRLASASGDRTVRLWDADSGQELLILRGHTSGVRAVAFSPDGSRLASTDDDGTVKIWYAPRENE